MSSWGMSEAKPLPILMVHCLIKHTDNFIFFLPDLVCVLLARLQGVICQNNKNTNYGHYTGP